MNIGVKVDADRLVKRLERMHTKVTKFNLSKDLAAKYARTLQKVISQRSTYASGNLAQSVKARAVGRYGSGVYAAHYFWHANYGREPGLAPYDAESALRFEGWAAKTGWHPDALAYSIAKHGTQPRFYFEAAKQIMQVEKPRAYKKILKSITR